MTEDEQGPAAYDDPATAAHERAKSRAFALSIGGGLLLAAVGVFLATQGSWGVLVGIVLFIIGGGFSFAAVIGFYFRRKARRTLSGHPWRTAPITVIGVPPNGSRGKVVVDVHDQIDRQLAITGATPELTHALKMSKQIEYAGDLSGTGMIFIREVDGAEVYVAMLRSR